MRVPQVLRPNAERAECETYAIPQDQPTYSLSWPLKISDGGLSSEINRDFPSLTRPAERVRIRSGCRSATDTAYGPFSIRLLLKIRRGRSVALHTGASGHRSWILASCMVSVMTEVSAFLCALRLNSSHL